MTLLYSARKVMNYVRNLPKLVEKIYDELTALDTRVSNLASTLTGIVITTITGPVTFSSGGVSSIGIKAILTAMLNDAAVTTPKMAIFVSTEQTANGSAQNVAHGLGVSPATVLVIPSATLAGATAFTFTKGSTNVVVTGTNTAKYYVLAIV